MGRDVVREVGLKAGSVFPVFISDEEQQYDDQQQSDDESDKGFPVAKRAKYDDQDQDEDEDQDEDAKSTDE